MKFLKVALITIVSLIAVVIIAAVIFIKTFDVNRFKPQIISQAQKALGRQLDFEKVSLGISLSQGISLKIMNLRIADDPAFSKDDFLAVKEIALGINVLKYILRKELDVPSILIEAPRVIIIRQKDGTLNASSLTQQAQPEGKPGVTQGISKTQAAPFALPALLITSLKLSGGTVTYIDRSYKPPMQVDVSDFNFLVRKLSLTSVFPFEAEAAVLSGQKNIRIEGKARINPKTFEVTISDLKAATDLSQMLPERIAVSFPMAKEMPLPQQLKGKVEVAVENFTAGPKGLTELALDVALTDGTVIFKEVASAVKDLSMKARVTQKDALINTISAHIGQGALQAKASITDYMAGQNIEIDASFDNLRLEELVSQEKAALKPEGVTSGKVKLKGAGFDPEALKSSLSGTMDFAVTKAKLKDINILRAVLDKISVIPGLSEKIEEKLPEKFKEKMAQKDTLLSDFNMPLLVENGSLVINDAVVGADEFVFKGKGKAGFSGAFSLEGAFFVTQELSAAMVSAVEELQYLLNEDKQIYIPLKISGKAAGELKLKVDGEYIAKKLLTEQGTQQLFKALDKVLAPKEKDQQPSGQNTAPGQQSGEEQKPSTEEKVKDILRGLLKQ
jgi:hypothetical protein